MPGSNSYTAQKSQQIPANSRPHLNGSLGIRPQYLIRGFRVTVPMRCRFWVSVSIIHSRTQRGPQKPTATFWYRATGAWGSTSRPEMGQTSLTVLTVRRGRAGRGLRAVAGSALMAVAQPAMKTANPAATARAYLARTLAIILPYRLRVTGASGKVVIRRR